jgi:hypothetical protein
MRGRAAAAFAVLALLVPLVLLAKLHNPSPEERGLFFGQYLILSADAPGGHVSGSLDQLLLMHVNDTLTFRMRGEGCRLESYNVTIAHLSTGERFSIEARGALAGRFPTFTAPREGVYLLESPSRLLRAEVGPARWPPSLALRRVIGEVTPSFSPFRLGWGPL